MKYKSRLTEENWTLMNDEVYIRDASGKETAIYENASLQYMNIWGAGLEAKVKKDEKGNTIFSYYYKDHLGSITAVMDGASGTITQAQDFDAWGDICRTYTTTDTTVNKFTGKERDQETGYDYFGARYYDSRVSVWLSPDPLFEKHLQWSPYNYVLRNPFVMIDPDGRQIVVVYSGWGAYNAGSEISENNYSPNSSVGAERLLFNIKNLFEEKGIPISNIKGYYASLGLLGEDEIQKASDFIFEKLNEKEQEVYLYGYSQGGNNIIELSEKLQNQGINVAISFAVDAFNGKSILPFGNFTKTLIPENTLYHYNYFQEKPDEITGAHGYENKAKDPSKTTVRNIRINKENVNHNNIDEYTIKNILTILKGKIK